MSFVGPGLFFCAVRFGSLRTAHLRNSAIGIDLAVILN